MFKKGCRGKFVTIRDEKGKTYHFVILWLGICLYTVRVSWFSNVSNFILLISFQFYPKHKHLICADLDKQCDTQNLKPGCTSCEND